jgi:hypothetical protein
VHHSHLTVGTFQKDFFDYTHKEFGEFDLIISNPPFSKKLKVFERLYEAKRPFAMLCNLMCLNYHEVGSFFITRPLELIIPNKRVSFDGNPSSFNTAWFCTDFLENELTFIHLPHNNTGKNFVGSFSP